MLVLSRKKNEPIVIDVPAGPARQIRIMPVDLRGDRVRLGVDAERDVTVHRQEVKDRIQQELRREADGDESSDAA